MQRLARPPDLKELDIFPCRICEKQGVRNMSNYLEPEAAHSRYNRPIGDPTEHSLSTGMEYCMENQDKHLMWVYITFQI